MKKNNINFQVSFLEFCQFIMLIYDDYSNKVAKELERRNTQLSQNIENVAVAFNSIPTKQKKGRKLLSKDGVQVG